MAGRGCQAACRGRQAAVLGRQGVGHGRQTAGHGRQAAGLGRQAADRRCQALGCASAGASLKVDALVAEIGSTTTLVNAFSGLEGDAPRLVGQGMALTTAAQGDVGLGLRAATDDLKERLGVEELQSGEMLATSSAAGGLRMTVHGLVYDMTVKAAKEAALGAGAIVKFVTAGRLSDQDLKHIVEINPNIVLLAGGVDYGEKDVVIYNARRIAGLGLGAPVIYAGNVAARDEIREVLGGAGIAVTIVDNVYPRIDQLSVEPTRRAIQRVFEEHITQAGGMQKIREMVRGNILPTPGAVMAAARLLYEKIGDLLVIDIGGATTDVHSVTEGSDEISRILVSPEPKAKRTVEGDLGVFVNARNLVELIGGERLQDELGMDVEWTLARLTPVPEEPDMVRFVARLAREAIRVAVLRHAGELRHLYGPLGRITVAQGKDLTQVKWVIGTGGVLSRLEGREGILAQAIVPDRAGTQLLPGPQARFLFDSDYIMASCGVMSHRRPDAALRLLMSSLRL